MVDDLKQWQAQRRAELNSSDSWLGVCGLFWLAAGLNSVGSDAGAQVRLPDGPARLGDLLWADGGLVWQPVDGESRILETDALGQPSVVDYESWQFFVIDRDGQLAVRLRDRNWAKAGEPAGLSYFDFDPDWQIDADWLPLSPPLRMEVPSAGGDLKTVEVAHRAVFEVAGQAVTLLPMSVGADGVLFVFRDRTSGKETYGAGRFLKAGPAVGGKIRLDFNFSYNPPCAFTPFATCPLPPPENRLPFPVPAGEKRWPDGKT